MWIWNENLSVGFTELKAFSNTLQIFKINFKKPKKIVISLKIKFSMRVLLKKT